MLRAWTEIDKFLNLSKSQFSPLKMGIFNRTYFIGLVWRFNEIMQRKYIALTSTLIGTWEGHQWLLATVLIFCKLSFRYVAQFSTMVFYPFLIALLELFIYYRITWGLYHLSFICCKYFSQFGVCFSVYLQWFCLMVSACDSMHRKALLFLELREKVLLIFLSYFL